MKLDRKKINNRIHYNLRIGKPIIGVAVGAGITARHAELGGADIILALNSGRFRQMGFSSLAGMMPFANSNKLVLEFGKREILRVVSDTPVLFGLCASDPTIRLDEFIEKIDLLGFSGINNFPTTGLIDGQYKKALEEAGIGYEHEVKAIEIANKKEIFTVAYVFNEEQAIKMEYAGADVICVHLGFTRGGILGTINNMSLERAGEFAQRIFHSLRDRRIIKLVYGGTVKTPKDMEFIYNNTDAQGYIGGSSFERIPLEEAVRQTTRKFKNFQNISLINLEESRSKKYFYIDTIKKYIAENYSKEILFTNIAKELHLSRNYLSSLFKSELGITFQSYLMKYRVRKATELIEKNIESVSEIAQRVGFKDLSHFSKTFKKVIGISPSEYINRKNDM